MQRGTRHVSYRAFILALWSLIGNDKVVYGQIFYALQDSSALSLSFFVWGMQSMSGLAGKVMVEVICHNTVVVFLASECMVICWQV